MTGEAASGIDLVRAAVPQFARAVGVVVAGPVEIVIPSGPVPILVLHAAALLAVLEARDHPHDGPVRVVADKQVLAGLLAREKVFWLGSAGGANLTGPGGVDSVVAGQAVAVACLLTVADETAAVAALRRVPALSDAPSGQLRQIARWLRQLYPAERLGTTTAPRWWGYLQPDLLAEWHTVGQMADAPDFARACLAGLTKEQANGALTVLARASAHRTEASAMIATALRFGLPALGVPAVTVAVQTGSGLGKIIAGVLGDADAQSEILMEIGDAIPYPTVALAEADVILTERITKALPIDTGRDEVARWNARLGVRLRQFGRPLQALPYTQESVAAYRELAAVNPDRYRPSLASSLNNLGVRFSDLSRPAEALPPTQEAVAIRRELAADSDRYRSDLSTSLSNLGVRFSELGHPAEALPPTQESVTIRRELAAVSPDRYRPDLATSLNNLGIWLSELDRPAEALSPAEEAVAIRRELAAVSPDRHRPDLAASLSNLAVTCWQMGHPADALPAEQEAVAIRRELAAVSPDRYRPDLASSLDNLAKALSSLGRDAEADAARAEAAAVRGEP